MNQFLKWIAISIALLIGVILFVLYMLKDPIDSCLDSGGCWDSIDKLCRKTEANAQELCDRSKQ